MINLEAFPVEDGAEALALMRHHLRLAAMYFMATDDPLPREWLKGESFETAMEAFVEGMEAEFEG